MSQEKLDLVLLDMDGVLCDFHTSAEKYHGKKLDWHKDGENLPNEVLWPPLEKAGLAFWVGLDPYPWVHDLIALARKYAAFVGVATSIPTGNAERDSICRQGKTLWLHKHVPELAQFAMIGKQKHWMAQRWRVLIDDTVGKCEDFAAHGGRSILFPHAYNEAQTFAQVPLEYVECQLQQAIALCEHADYNDQNDPQPYTRRRLLAATRKTRQ